MFGFQRLKNPTFVLCLLEKYETIFLKILSYFKEKEQLRDW